MPEKHYYLRYDQLNNEHIAWQLTEDPRAAQAVDFDCPLHRIETLVGVGHIRESVETITYGARSWRACIVATEAHMRTINAHCGPYVESIAEEEWDQDCLVCSVR